MDQVFAVRQVSEKNQIVSSKLESCILCVYGFGKGI